MKNSLLLLLIFTSTCLYSNAQGVYDIYPTANNAKQVLSRPLIIEKHELDEKTRAKLAKSSAEDLKFEEDLSAYFNDAILNIFKENYKGSKDITLKSLSEINPQDLANSIVLKHGLIKNCYKDPNNKSRCEKTYTFSLFLGNEKEEQGRFSFLDEIFSEADFLFLCQQINNLMADAAAGKSNPSQKDFFAAMPERTKGKTLVLSPRELNPKLAKADIEKTYSKGKLEFVETTEELNNYIVDRTAGKMYVASGYNGPLYGVTYYLVDAETGEIISAMSSGGIRFAIGAKPDKDLMKRMGYSLSERRQMGVLLYSFKPNHQLRLAHFKYWNKFI